MSYQRDRTIYKHLSGYIEGGYTGYNGPPKWLSPNKLKKTYPIAQIISSARRFEADGEIENGRQLREIAAARIKWNSRWYKSLQRRPDVYS